MVDKAALRAELHGVLTAALEAARLAYAAAIEGATHPEARAENDKDTRGLEQSYLARGQAQRVAELEAAVNDVAVFKPRAFIVKDPISLGAVVVIEEDGARRSYFVAPGGGGSVLDGDVQVITTASPLGRALLGKCAGDEVELRLSDREDTKARELEIISVT